MGEVNDLKNKDFLEEFPQQLSSEPTVEISNSDNSQVDLEGKNGANNSNNVHLEDENLAEAPKSSGDHQSSVKVLEPSARTNKVSESSEKTPSGGERRTRPSTPQRVVTSRPPTPTRKFDEKYALIRERKKANEFRMGLLLNFYLLVVLIL